MSGQQEQTLSRAVPLQRVHGLSIEMEGAVARAHGRLTQAHRVARGRWYEAYIPRAFGRET